MSPDEKAHADSKGITLIEMPIALDAFIFIVNPENPVTSLTIKQIQDIYTGKITNWNEAGGNDLEIRPFLRNANSGSQELMESLVMKDIDGIWFPDNPEASKTQIISSMVPVFDHVTQYEDSICYTIYYFKETMLKNYTRSATKTIAINGIYPNEESIKNNTYSLSTEVYAVIRSDLSESSKAYKLYEFLQTELGKDVIRESGYLCN